MTSQNRTNTHNQTLGRWGESLAAETLTAKGYEILARNTRTGSGEIDLIARKAGLLVFVEVKTRRGDEYGTPEEAITPAKQQHMEDAAQAWLAEHPEETGAWQFDVIAIFHSPGMNQPEITHLEGTLD
ncbi:MAG: YraN family protein [Anaerolineaceae bacterium]